MTDQKFVEFEGSIRHIVKRNVEDEMFHEVYEETTPSGFTESHR